MPKAFRARTAQVCAKCKQPIPARSYAAYPPGQNPGPHHLACVDLYPGLGAKFVTQFGGPCSLCWRPTKRGDVVAYLGDTKQIACGVCMVSPPPKAKRPSEPGPLMPTPARSTLVPTPPKRRSQPRTFDAKFRSRCHGCDGWVDPGDRAGSSASGEILCPDCLSAQSASVEILSRLPSPELHAFLNVAELHGGRLLPHQETAVLWALEHPRALNRDATGLGKTVMGAGYISALRARGLVDNRERVAWITEANLCEQSVEELGRFLTDTTVTSSAHPRFRKSPTLKSQREWEAEFPDGAMVYVLSYDFVTGRSEDVAGIFGDRLPLLVLDEVTAIKAGEGAPTWEAVHALSARADRTYGLTATPTMNDPTETYAILAALRTPGLMPKDDFEDRYIDWRPGFADQWGRWVDRKPIGFQDGMAAPFAAYLRKISLGRTLSQARVRRPFRVGERYVWVPLSGKQAQEHKRAEGLAGLRRHHALERTGRYASDGSSATLDAAMTNLLARPHEQKVVIGTEDLHLLALLCERLDRAGIGYVTVEGKTNKEHRVDAVRRHRGDPTIQVFAGSRVLELGLNLQHANVLLSLDTSWNPAREIQREGRICRIGSPHDTYEHISFVPDTQRARKKYEDLLRKRQVAQQALGQST